MHFFMLFFLRCVYVQRTDLQVEWSSLLLASQPEAARGICISISIRSRIDGSVVAAHGCQFYPDASVDSAAAAF